MHFVFFFVYIYIIVARRETHTKNIAKIPSFFARAIACECVLSLVQVSRVNKRQRARELCQLPTIM